MKKILVVLCVAGFIVSLASPLMAGGIDNKHNWSAEWIRTLNRNAATDSADAVVYNPAGVMKMEDGLYVNFTGQYGLKDYSNTLLGTKYETDEPDFIPSLFGLYRKDKWAAYGAMTILVAGGTVDYKDGSTTTFLLADSIITAIGGVLSDHSIEGESYFIGYTLGGSYAINDMVSVSLGARFVDAYRQFKGHATINGTALGDIRPTVDYEETDSGWGGILGVNYAPTEELNIGLRYETKTSLDLKTDEKEDSLNGSPIMPDGIVVDGAERNRDLPALLGLGVSYKINPKIRVESNLTYYFQDDADWDDNPVSATADESKKDNGYDIGVACEYTFNPEWKGSVGIMYTDVGIDPDDMSIEAPELNATTIGGGAAYKATPSLDLNFGLLTTFYKSETTSTGIKYEKDVTIISAGIQYKFK